MRLALLLLPALLLTATTAEAQRGSETRCGWVVNPTPGNYWLLDRHTRTNNGWLISAQGGYAAVGTDLLPDFSGKEWVKTNGNYGYGCGCLRVRTDRRNRQITRIYSVAQAPLAQCRRDKALPRPE